MPSGMMVFQDRFHFMLKKFCVYMYTYHLTGPLVTFQPPNWCQLQRNQTSQGFGFPLTASAMMDLDDLLDDQGFDLLQTPAPKPQGVVNPANKAATGTSWQSRKRRHSGHVQDLLDIADPHDSFTRRHRDTSSPEKIRHRHKKNFKEKKSGTGASLSLVHSRRKQPPVNSDCNGQPTTTNCLQDSLPERYMDPTTSRSGEATCGQRKELSGPNSPLVASGASVTAGCSRPQSTITILIGERGSSHSAQLDVSSISPTEEDVHCAAGAFGSHGAFTDRLEDSAFPTVRQEDKKRKRKKKEREKEDEKQRSRLGKAEERNFAEGEFSNSHQSPSHQIQPLPSSHEASIIMKKKKKNKMAKRLSNGQEMESEKDSKKRSAAKKITPSKSDQQKQEEKENLDKRMNNLKSGSSK